MAHFLVQVAYTSNALATLIKNPQDRTEAIRSLIESLGGSFESAWFAFGDYDVVLICQMPDNISAAAFSFAGSAGGAIKTIKTTPLMSIEEGVEALRKASGTAYQPPSA
jgi:uncharacterized protein with GYD domain